MRGIIQCIRKVFRPLHCFHVLLCYSLILKLIQSFFFSSSIYPQNDKAKTLNITFTYVFRPFTQYFVKVPLAVISAWSLLGYDATSLAHLYLGSFPYSSLQILSSSVKVGWGALLHSYFWVSRDVRSGSSPGSHSRTFSDLSQSHSCVVLAVCLGLLSS